MLHRFAAVSHLRRACLIAPLLAVAACAGSSAERQAPCAPHGCNWTASQRLAFEDPPIAPSTFHCLAPGTPERDPRGGECLADSRACVALAVHLMRSYGRSDRGQCIAQRSAWCFQQMYWGKRMEICLSSAASCEARRLSQTHDDRVSDITAACKVR